MRKFLSFVMCAVLTAALIISQTGCGEKTEKVEKTSYYMDTICTITVYDMDDMSEEAAGKAIDAAFALCAEYESLISATVEGSDIYRINHAGGESVECDPRTVDLLQTALDYGKKSDGKFDVTVGKLTDLWDFHAEDPQVPSAAAVKEALSTVDYEKVDISGNTVTMKDPKAHINLGGIGKGYVGDRAAECLQEQGVTSAVINFGGNIIAVGDKAGAVFEIGIQKPFAEQEYLGVVGVKDASVVTSGIYERGFEKDGKYYHHILDVKTGWPVENDVVSVTLVGGLGHSADCDAMATICLMLGVEDGIAYVESVDGMEALFVDSDGNITKTSGMDDYLEDR